MNFVKNGRRISGTRNAANFIRIFIQQNILVNIWNKLFVLFLVYFRIE